MKNTTTDYMCDNGCNKRTRKLNQFPYDEGWIYIHQLNFKAPQRQGGKVVGVVHQLKDKHLCSSKCFGEYMVKAAAGEVK